MRDERPTLPVDSVLPELDAALGRAGVAVVVAPPGAGKTTRVPPHLVRSGEGAGTILMLQPRRMAARASARRMAVEQGWTLGHEVGFQVRHERRLRPDTAIQVLTEGILLRRLQADPFLSGVGTVILDEFHLRSLETDLCLALLREVRADARPDLRIVVMSATMDPGPVSAFLGDAPVVRAEGRLHHLEIVRDERRDERPLARRVASAVREELVRGDGDLLVFLPGMAEIRRCAEALDDLAGVEVMPLHGSLGAEAQDRVLSPGERRRVVLATNVAETSLTIPGVRVVVDSGLVKQIAHDPASGLDRLETRRIALDAADQRAGRAGRLGPGRVRRLWTAEVERGMLAVTPPEIRRVDLAATVLELRAWGVDPRRFAWFEAPEGASIDVAERFLEAMGALEDDGGLGAVGRRLLALPLHPRLGRLLVASRDGELVEEGALLAALLSEPDPMGREHLDERGEALEPGPSDLVDRFERIRRAEGAGGRTEDFRAEGLRPAPARAVLRVARDLGKRMKDAAREGPAEGASSFCMSLGEADGPSGRSGMEERLGRLLLAAYADRLACRRGKGDERAVMVGGRGLRLAPSSVLRHGRNRLFLALKIDGAGTEGRVSWAHAVEETGLEGTRTERLCRFDETRERVETVARTLFADLVLREKPVPSDPGEAGRVLAEAAARDWRRAFSPDEAAESWLVRLEACALHRPELDWPRLDDEAFRAFCPLLAAGRRSFAELRALDLLAFLKGHVGHRVASEVERFAPERLEVPTGEKIRLRWERGADPVLAVQLQRLFGMAETPRVMGGRLPVTLHLLAPSGRPVQITRDLSSFWNGAYGEVRKDLRGRYPKHAWPEDPWNAPPERRPRPRRS